jgi:hypothetical protein
MHTHTRLSRLLLIAVAAVAVGAADAQPSREYQLKAAFVHRFMQFVEWPQGALDAGDSVQVCVAPPDPFGDELPRVMADDELFGKRVAVRRIERPVEAAECHVVFAGAGSAAPAVLAVVAGKPVLTVGEGEDFLEAGGIIQLRTVDRRVRFDVHLDNARRAGLRISSRLLSLALTVHGGRS